MNNSKLYFLFLLSVLFVSEMTYSMNSNTLLLIVSFDGFRYDYFDRNLTETLVNLRRSSSYTPYMLSVFPTKTFPNHFSIATGLYTEVHGVLDNSVFDVTTNKSLGYGYELFHYNEDVVPIWTLNERGGSGRRSGCMMWPGSDLPYQRVLPSHFRSYNVSVSWHSRVDTVLGWYTHPETPINLGMLYFEQPDLICHSYGPDSSQVDGEIARVDRIVRYLLDRALEVGILHRLNIVFLSDHGGQGVPVPSHSINLDNYINRSWYIRDGVPPNLQIFPARGREDEVLRTLKSARGKGGNFSTYTRAEMPERWGYKHCGRTPPILLSADIGYLFLARDRNYTSNSSVIGTHGYDPLTPTMRAFFMAVGPDFKKNHSIPPFENINIFPLAAHMLGLPLPRIRPNGSLLPLKDILLTHQAEDGHATVYLAVGVIVAALLVITAVAAFLIRRHIHRKAQLRDSSTASYRVLNQIADDKEQETLLSDCEEHLEHLPT